MGLPWLDQPVMLHSSREDHCKYNAEQCAYRDGFWRYWYQADHRYALTVVYFMIAFIAFFAIGNIFSSLPKNRYSSSNIWRRIVACCRYLTYRSFHVRIFDWWSPSLAYILVGLAGTVFFFALCLGPRPYYWPNTDEVSYGSSPPLATRAGWMAIALLPFILALSAKANFITAVTGVSHEKLQVFHRWTSYAMFVLALIHTFPFIVYHIDKGDMVEEYNSSIVYWTGIAAIIPQAYLTVMSFGPIRNRFYEFFKSTHLLAATFFVVFFFLHCDFRLTAWDYFIAAGSLYFASLLFSQLRTYFGYGFGHKAYLTKLPSGMVQVTIPIHPSTVVKTAVPIGFTWTPGQHVFLRFLTLGLHSLTSHPFTICSLPPLSQKDYPELRFLIAPAGGFTSRLSRLAEKQPNMSVRVLLDGPYGGLNVRTLATFDKALLIAGGSGAGFTLPLLEDTLRKARTGSDEVRSTHVHVIVATRSREVLDWYSEEVRSILDMYPEARLSVSMHVTGAVAATEETSHTLPVPESEFERDHHHEGEKADAHLSVNSSKALSRQKGRPDLRTIIDASSREEGKSVAIAVCGPAEMLYDVRNAAANAQSAAMRPGGAREVYLHSEHFA
ncbi:ferric reductase [Saccharata proteae CBS 121410]|uniref:ferric-chelate reductase (NADPH) n=1 Tax=Saccharata proteae CBS 121410 TaxID=1314787 RepID=A0A9P4M255_9PEZI|nr:ferric reductase [Saccharata proteae CBS 121410]